MVRKGVTMRTVSAAPGESYFATGKALNSRDSRHYHRLLGRMLAELARD